MINSMAEEIKNNQKILIVEDDEALRKVLDDKFTSQGFEVLEAKNGEEGLVTALSLHPDLIFLDIIMPVMDGMTMLNNLRKDEWGKKVPVIIMTNVDAMDVNDINKISKNLGSDPLDYHVKSNTSIEKLVAMALERLKS